MRLVHIVVVGRDVRRHGLLGLCGRRGLLMVLVVMMRLMAVVVVVRLIGARTAAASRLSMICCGWGRRMRRLRLRVPMNVRGVRVLLNAVRQRLKRVVDDAHETGEKRSGHVARGASCGGVRSTSGSSGGMMVVVVVRMQMRSGSGGSRGGRQRRRSMSTARCRRCALSHDRIIALLFIAVVRVHLLLVLVLLRLLLIFMIVLHLIVIISIIVAAIAIVIVIRGAVIARDRLGL